jgi:hypothetical protein
MRRLFSFFALLALSFTACHSANSNSTLVGRWLFVEWEYPAGVEVAGQWQSNAMNEGMVFTFTQDGRYISKQEPEGLPENNFSTTYTLEDSGKKLVANGVTYEIRLLDAETLKLFVEQDRPIAVFKRLHP